MDHYVYSVYNTNTGKYLEHLTLTRAAAIIGIQPQSLARWATRICEDSYEFGLTPINASYMVSRKAGRNLNKGFTEYQLGMFAAEWNKTCAPFKALQARRDARREAAHGT